MSRLFIGGLKEGASRTELEKEFETFGPLREVWVARKPPGFGFILFEEVRDAEDALKEMDGQYVCGGRIRVEQARDSGGGGGGRGGSRGGGGGGGYRGGGGGNTGECYNCGRFGHFGRDCKKGSSTSYGYGGGSGGGGGGGSGGRRRSRSRSRSRSNERDRKQSTKKYSRRSHSRSRSPERSHR